MRPINYFDWFYAVDIKGHDSSGVYSMKQIKRARNEFQPVVALSLFRQLALIPGGKVQRDVAWVKNVRKAVFEEIDETRVLSYGDQSENYNYSTIDLGQLQKEIPFQVPQSRPIEVSEAVGQTKKSASSVELTNQLERETCTSKQYEKGECTSCDRKVESQGSKTHQYEILKDGTDESFKINSIEESGQIISCDKGNSLTSQPQKENKANHTLSSDSMDDMQVLGSVRTEAELFPVRSPLSARALSLPLDSIPPKKRIKLDGYPMTCQQSSIHDDREEIPQRVQRGVNKSKAVAAEEKARNQVDIKSRNRNQEKRDSVHVVNEVKHLPKKPETCVKIEKPTFLIVRFPSKSALPSFSELKAKFVRFGPLDLSATHVSWKSSTCIVAFKCKSDALAAYDYATQNKFLFGNANVHYQLQASEIPPYNHKYLEISL